MSDEWHDLPERDHQVEPGKLALPRSQGVLAAIEKRRDVKLIWCAQHQLAGPLQLETIVADFSCEGVPSRNSVGIEVPERIAIRIFDDTSLGIEARALRKGFPLLLHQNAVVPGTAPSLCLYAEPTAAVNRSWTPERFLARIENWLTRSAHGNLHLDSQPVEQLFFTVGSELVLPHDFETRRSELNLKAWVTFVDDRANGSNTYTLRWSPPGVSGNGKLVDVIYVELAPVVHGRPEEDLTNLGQLQAIFSDRGVDFGKAFGEAIRARFASQAGQRPKQESFTMVLLEVPVARTVGGAVERRFRRAFIVKKGFLDLGEGLGVLMQHEGSYYLEQQSEILRPAPSTVWHSIQVVCIDVLPAMSKSLAQAQSGINEAGPRAVLVGAGSLGATLLEVWFRFGWGNWSVIDSDYIKPHNLVRHPTSGFSIGQNKAEAAAWRSQQLFDDGNPVVAIPINALDAENKTLRKAFADAEVVVDATADLDFPRLASMGEGVPRHVSTFFTPSANSSVLLMEDSARKSRLRTLEAQYYRVVINEKWGENHLKGHRGLQWTGAGCRDKSAVIPYSAVMAHSATLAEQVMQLLRNPAAAMKVWERNSATGEVALQSYDCFPEYTMKIGEVLVSIDEGLLKKLRTLRQEQLPNETGGILLGYHDFNLNILVIVDATPAPPDSVATASSFKRGTKGIREILEAASSRTAGIVQYVGEWHSHPPHVNADPSTDDRIQILNLMDLLADDGLPALSLIVGDVDDFTVMLGSST